MSRVGAPARSSLLSRRDLDFLLFEWLRVGELTEREQFKHHSVEVFGDLLDMCEKLATKHFATHNKLSDQNEPALDGEVVRLIPEIGEALRRYIDAGLPAMAFDSAAGGGQVPHTVAVACNAWFQAANIATYSYVLLSIANANLILSHGTDEQIERFAKPIIAGRFFGTMCLSEPQAGSSLAGVATLAEPREGGTYRLTGTKMWISAGEHALAENIVHLVLARTPGAPEGVKGLSLFIVPKWLVADDGQLADRNDVTVAGLNHKMGYRGTVNTVLSFGEGRHQPGGGPGAVGYLVGRLGEGLACMFHMMNEARIAVGAGATALGYTGFLKSLQYAKVRQQGTRPGGSGSAQATIIEHPDVKRMLLTQKSYVEGAMALTLFCASLLDEQTSAPDPSDGQRAAALLDLLTPIAKSWPSQWCLAANDLAIQVHGGYGYTRDYDVEQHYRDNRLNLIHEGTHGIQAIDLLVRRVRFDSGANFDVLVRRIGTTAARAAKVGGEAARLAVKLNAAIEHLSEVTWRVVAGIASPTVLPNAMSYLEGAGHVVLAWVWLEQYLACEGKSGNFYEGKRHAARYFFAHELPKATLHLSLLERHDDTIASTVIDWL